MLGVTIFAVGSLKEKYFTDACAEYRKRLQPFCNLNVVEIDEFRLGQNPGNSEIQKCLQTEGKNILQKLSPKPFAISLCIEGKPLTSPQLAEKIERISSENSQLAFIIGGSHGLSGEVKARSNLMLSMSDMTFPHQLARVMLLEQLYRAFSISGGLKYHK